MAKKKPIIAYADSNSIFDACGSAIFNTFLQTSELTYFFLFVSFINYLHNIASLFKNNNFCLDIFIEVVVIFVVGGIFFVSRVILGGISKRLIHRGSYFLWGMILGEINACLIHANILRECLLSTRNLCWSRFQVWIIHIIMVMSSVFWNFRLTHSTCVQGEHLWHTTKITFLNFCFTIFYI